MPAVRLTLRWLAFLGFVLFAARCAAGANAVEPPLRSEISAWTGESTPGGRFSYTIVAFSNASASSTVTAIVTLDRRLTALPDHRDPECVGIRPVVCTFHVFRDHPASATITVRVNDHVCGGPLWASIAVRDDRGNYQANRAPVGLYGGRCALYLPVFRSSKGVPKK
jgi:hypothetical protein